MEPENLTQRLRLLSVDPNLQRTVMAVAVSINLWTAFTPGGWPWLSWLFIAFMVTAQAWVELNRLRITREIAAIRAQSSNPARDAAMARWMTMQSHRDTQTIIAWNLAIAFGERHEDDAPPIVRKYRQLERTWDEVDR